MPDSEPTANRLPLTPAERADLRQKAEQATPGPWAEDIDTRIGGADQVMFADRRGRLMTLCFISSGRDDDDSSEADARYIAAISPDRLLALLDEVERLEQAERLRQAAEAKRNAPTPQCQCPAYDAARERGGYPSGICPDCGQWYPGRRGPRGSSKPAEGSTP